MSKKTEETEGKYKIIRKTYKLVYGFAKGGHYKLAKKILYEEMPAELYDLSLDILYNRNSEFSNQELRTLIEEVDNLLNKEDEGDFETDLTDNYSNF